MEALGVEAAPSATIKLGWRAGTYAMQMHRRRRTGEGFARRVGIDDEELHWSTATPAPSCRTGGEWSPCIAGFLSPVGKFIRARSIQAVDGDGGVRRRRAERPSRTSGQRRQPACLVRPDRVHTAPAVARRPIAVLRRFRSPATPFAARPGRRAGERIFPERSRVPVRMMNRGIFIGAPSMATSALRAPCARTVKQDSVDPPIVDLV